MFTLVVAVTLGGAGWGVTVGLVSSKDRVGVASRGTGVAAGSPGIVGVLAGSIRATGVSVGAISPLTIKKFAWVLLLPSSVLAIMMAIS
jgi:hypothetical protein